MDLLVNAAIGWVVLIFQLVRGLLEWGDKALLVGIGAGLGAYLGTRPAHTHHQPTRRRVDDRG